MEGASNWHQSDSSGTGQCGKTCGMGEVSRKNPRILLAPLNVKFLDLFEIRVRVLGKSGNVFRHYPGQKREA
jgi:hypothetical protein